MKCFKEDAGCLFESLIRFRVEFEMVEVVDVLKSDGIAF
jgi:hypothetical protein